MTVFLTFATALAAGWVIDRLAFRGELVAMVRDEIAFTWARRKQPPARSPRRGATRR
jgi:hypothetical protein